MLRLLFKKGSETIQTILIFLISAGVVAFLASGIRNVFNEELEMGENSDAYRRVAARELNAVGKLNMLNAAMKNEKNFIVENGTLTGYNDTGIREIVIPNDVKVIEDKTPETTLFKFQDATVLVLPETLTKIGYLAFSSWKDNNQKLTIPKNVKTIEGWAFDGWTSNNKPLTLNEGLVGIGGYAFNNWRSNTHPIIIPSTVTYIYPYAFKDWLVVPYIIMKPTTPPTLGANAFEGQYNAPIYVPDESITLYLNAPNWSNLAHRIKPLSEL